jgi:hypothetical protein
MSTNSILGCVDTHNPDEFLTFYVEEILLHFEAYIKEGKVSHLRNIEENTITGLTSNEAEREWKFQNDTLQTQQLGLCRDAIASFILLFLLMQDLTKVRKK